MGVGPLCRLHRLPVCPPSRPTRREFAQTNNCSDRRVLVCSDRAAIAREGRYSVREVGGQAEQAVWSRRRGPVCSGPSASPGRHVSSAVCKPAGTHSQACQWPQPAQADVFWVLLFRLSGNCFPSGPASGTRCQVVLWEGVMEGWKDRVYYQSAMALEAVLCRLSSFFLVLHVA